MRHHQRLECRRLLSIAVTVEEVTIPEAAIAADRSLGKHRTFDVRATFDGSSFVAGGFTAQLTRGTFYRPMGDAAVVPPLAMFPLLPNLEYATFVTLPGLVPPPLGTLPYQDRTAIFTETVFHPVWGGHGIFLPTSGTYTIARLTTSVDAEGWIEGEVFSRETPNVPVRFMSGLPGDRPVGMVSGPALILQSGAHPQQNTHYWQVYADLNGNERLDAGEPWDWTNNRFDLVVPVGEVTVRVNLKPGYVAHPTLPASYTTEVGEGDRLEAPALAVAAVDAARLRGKVMRPVGFGFDLLGPLDRGSAALHVDADRDGVQDLDETVRLAHDAVTFDNLPTGDVDLRVMESSGWRPIPGLPDGLRLHMSANADLDGFRFFVNDRHSVSGRVSVVGATDRAPLFGARVFDDMDGDGALDADEPSAALGDGGSFIVFAVRPARMNLQILPPSGFTVAPGNPAGYPIDLPTTGPTTDRTGFHFVLVTAASAGRPAALVVAPPVREGMLDDPDLV